MRLPLSLIIPAILAAAVVAYGMHPAWAQFSHGLGVIMLTRRLQWPLLALCVALCLAFIGLIASGRCRAWWTIGLLPVLALFIHRFVNDPSGHLAILDNPPMVAASGAPFLGNDDYVVGLEFGDQAFAFPYSGLYAAPVVFLDDHDRRMVLIWSAFANRAMAFRVTRDVRARDLEIVGQPANSLLIYNRKLGQFIVGVTGHDPAGAASAGFGDIVRTRKLRWLDWQAAHPRTLVMQCDPRTGPRSPIEPRYPLPREIAQAGGPPTTITFLNTDPPAALAGVPESPAPLNLDVAQTPVVVFGSPHRAFERRIGERTLQFRVNVDRRWPLARFSDSGTGTGWNEQGIAVYGPTELKGKKLRPIELDDQLPWGATKYWYPGLMVVEAGPTTTRPVIPAR